MGASRNAIPGPVKFPVNRPGKLTGLVVTGSFEKQIKWTGCSLEILKRNTRGGKILFCECCLESFLL